MNRKMKNTELLADEKVKAAMEAEAIVLIDKVPTSNPEYTNLYFFGKVTGMGASGEVSAAASMFLGWSTSYNARAIQNARTEIADKIEIGTKFDELAFRTVDSLKPSFDGQTPRTTKDGEILLHEGQQVYRNYEVVTKEELEAKGHITLKITKDVVEKPVGTSIDNLIQK